MICLGKAHSKSSMSSTNHAHPENFALKVAAAPILLEISVLSNQVSPVSTAPNRMEASRVTLADTSCGQYSFLSKRTYENGQPTGMPSQTNNRLLIF